MTTKAKQVQVTGTPVNYTPATPSVQGHLEGIDTALGASAAPGGPQFAVQYQNPLGTFAGSSGLEYVPGVALTLRQGAFQGESLNTFIVNGDASGPPYVTPLTAQFNFCQTFQVQNPVDPALTLTFQVGSNKGCSASFNMASDGTGAFNINSAYSFSALGQGNIGGVAAFNNFTGFNVGVATGPGPSNVTIFDLNPTTAASLSAGRLLSWDGTQNVYVDPPAAGAAGPDRSIQFNNTGAFDGSAELTFSASATERQVRLQSPSPTGNARLVLRDSTGANRGTLTLSDTNDTVTLSGTSGLLLSGTGTVGLQLYGGAPSGTFDRWPSTDPAPGQILTAAGGGLLNWTTPSAVGTLSALQTYPLGTIDNSLAVWTGASGGSGNAYFTAIVADGNTAPLADMALLVLQTAVGAGGVGCAIYNAAGVRLAYSLVTASVLGLQVLPFSVGSGLTLTAGQLYYLGVYSNRNGVFVGSRNGIVSTPAGTPPLGFNVPNSGAQVGALEGWPANVSSFFGNMNASRPWSAAGA